MSVDWSKPIRTRAGEPARLLGVINSSGHTHHVAVKVSETEECLIGAYKSGQTVRYDEGPDDIVNVPETIETFMNIYKGSGRAVYCYGSLQSAKDAASQTAWEPPIGHVKITLTDGVPTKVELV